MPLDPIKIPQNVYIEDRIVGPLTLKQVITVALGGGFSYLLWASLSKTYGNLPLPIMIMVWIPALLSVAFAFVRINDLSLLKIGLLMIEQMEKPAKRVWTPRQGITINLRTFSGTEEAKHPLPQKSSAPIEQLTKTLDAVPAGGSGAGSETGSGSGSSEPEPANTRLPVDPKRIQADPLRGSGTIPRNTIFRDLSPA
jgi:hypothetical protein